jgi:amidohydrolase
MPDWKATIADFLPEIVDFRHDLHAHPEPSFGEHRTCEKVRQSLEKIPGMSVRGPLAGTGLVATLNEDKAGACVALRADLDALPIQEDTGKPYASTNPGYMHACGHDGHTSCLLGAARALSTVADQLPGCVKFVFQPAEEDGAGAEKMCEAGVLESPKVDAIFALHCSPEDPIHNVAINPGPNNAATNPFYITLKGRQAHGAYPHKSIDPIVAGAHLITALQTIASRNVNPMDTVVVTVGMIHGGTAINIIPETCELAGTIRTFNPDTRGKVVQRVREIAERIAETFNAEAEVNIINGYPVLINDDACTDFVARVSRDLLGDHRVRTDRAPGMGAEDFAYYAQQVPAAMFRLGMLPPDMDAWPALHTPWMDFNDDILPTGIELFSEIAYRYLHEHAKA